MLEQFKTHLQFEERSPSKYWTVSPSHYHEPKFKFIDFFVVVPRRGHLGIASFQHILQDLRTRNISLILVTPGLNQPKKVWGKALQALSSIPRDQI